MMNVKAWVDYKGQIANWGDAVNSELVRLITGVKPKLIASPYKLPYPNYLVIGSTLKWTDSGSVVWGAGFMCEKDVCYEKPHSVCAVRGPKSKERLLELEIFCPEIYGDPVLLLPRFYKPKVEKKYKLGIVPHWQDQFHPVVTSYLVGRKRDFELVMAQSRAALLAKGTPSYEQVRQEESYKFIDRICECEKIASSSLHGLVCADAYGIPSVQISFFKLTQFKFEDYFLSVGRKNLEPIDCGNGIDVAFILKSFEEYEITIDLDKLYSVCPFMEWFNPDYIDNNYLGFIGGIK